MEEQKVTEQTQKCQTNVQQQKDHGNRFLGSETGVVLGVYEAGDYDQSKNVLSNIASPAESHLEQEK